MDGMDDAIENGVGTAVSFLVDLLQFAIILLLGWLIALLLRRLATVLLTRAGLDSLVERGPARSALPGSRSATGLVATFVFWATLLVALQVAVSAFGPSAFSGLLGRLVGLLPDLAIAVLLLVAAVALATAARNRIGAADLPYGRVLAATAFGVIIGIGVVAALSQLGIATAVTVPVLIVVLLTLGAILVVGVGGGLIDPMRRRWEQVLTSSASDGRRDRPDPDTRG